MTGRQSREPRGQPTGGQFATTPKAASGLSLTGEPWSSEVHAHRVATRAGWPLLGDILVDMAGNGDIHTSNLGGLSDEQATGLGDDHIGPLIDAAETWASRVEAGSDAGKFEVEQASIRCQQAEVPTTNLNHLTGHELRELHTHLEGHSAWYQGSERFANSSVLVVGGAAGGGAGREPPVDPSPPARRDGSQAHTPPA